MEDESRLPDSDRRILFFRRALDNAKNLSEEELNANALIANHFVQLSRYVALEKLTKEEVEANMYILDFAFLAFKGISVVNKGFLYPDMFGLDIYQLANKDDFIRLVKAAWEFGMTDEGREKAHFTSIQITDPWNSLINKLVMSSMSFDVFEEMMLRAREILIKTIEVE